MGAYETVIVRDFIAAINRRRPAEMSELMTEDHTFVDSLGREESGRWAAIAGWTEYFRCFPDYSIRIEMLLSQGSHVAVFGSASGTYSGPQGLVAENRMEMPAAWRAVVEQGRVKRWQVYADGTEGRRVMAMDDSPGLPQRSDVGV